jgi:hypothetical protein
MIANEQAAKTRWIGNARIGLLMSNIGSLELCDDTLRLRSLWRSATLRREEVTQVIVPPLFRFGIQGMQIHHTRSDLPHRLTFWARPWNAASILGQLHDRHYRTG